MNALLLVELFILDIYNIARSIKIQHILWSIIELSLQFYLIGCKFTSNMSEKIGHLTKTDALYGYLHGHETVDSYRTK